MDKVILKSNSGTSILKQLSDLNNKNLKFLKNEEKNFKEKETKLISQKNIITEADFQNKVNELKSEIKNYNQNRNKMMADFNKLKIDNTNNLLKLINPILIKFSNDKEIAIIFQKKDVWDHPDLYVDVYSKTSYYALQRTFLGRTRHVSNACKLSLANESDISYFKKRPHMFF